MHSLIVVLLLAVAVTAMPRSQLHHKRAKPASGAGLSLADIVEMKKEQLKRSLGLRVLDCKQLGDDCSGVPTCCGENQCYWEDGYSMITSGVCVDCVRENQLCQRDSQCCSPLVCHREDYFDMDGACGPKRGPGEPCHEDDNCASADCDKAWYELEGDCN